MILSPELKKYLSDLVHGCLKGWTSGQADRQETQQSLKFNGGKAEL